MAPMDDCIELPPGFRFHPTDEEIITHYLSPKAVNQSFTATAIGEVDLNKCEPWELPSKAKMGEKEWYFYCQRDRKYPTGMRTNRATAAGYWKATGKDKDIFMSGKSRNALIGMKKTLVFYTGRAPKGDKTNWVMHEYRLHLHSPLLSNLPNPVKDEWGVCRVFHKSNGAVKKMIPQSVYGDLMDSPSLPPLMDYSRPASRNYYFNNNNDVIDERFGFKEMNATSSYLSSIAGIDDFSAMTGQINPLTNPYSMPAAAVDYQAGLRKCKVEQQLPNRSIVSEDTAGTSTDRNTDISSVVSRHDAYDDLDLGDMWKC